MNGSEYVFVGQKMVEAQVLGRPGEPTDCGGITVKLELGICDADLHEPQLFTDESHVPPR